MSEKTAHRVLRELGPGAREAVKLCVEECQRLRDERAAQFWSDVSAHLEGGTNSGASCADDEFVANDVHVRRRRWAFMQRAELYRHRALKAEQVAGGLDRQQDDMLDLAMQWFELARQYERLAEVI